MSNVIQWEELARRGKNHALLLIDQVCEAYARGWLGPALDSNLEINFYRQVAGARWMDTQSIVSYVAVMKSKEEQQPGFLLEKAKERNAVVFEMRDFAASLQPSASFDQAKQDVEKFVELGVTLWITAYHYIMLNKFYPDLLTARIAAAEKDLRKQNEYLRVLFELPEPTEARLEKNSLLEIGLAAAKNPNWKNDPAIINEIDMHLKKFAHLGLHYYWGKPFSVIDILNRLEVLLSKDLKVEQAAAEEQQRVKEKTREIFKLLHLTREEQLMVDTIRAWGQTANYADETYSLCVYKLTPAINQVCKQWNITYNQFASMRVSEIYNAFQNGFSSNLASELSARYKDHAIIYENGKIITLSGAELMQYKARELKQEESMHHMRELTGQPVCPGKVTGAVHIVQSLEDADALPCGAILVAPSTIPPYVPAMERAAAIVTNEGGLLCHAAIVARELNIPCIVGTRIATAVFQNGERIEVDAVNGIVKKLNL